MASLKLISPPLPRRLYKDEPLPTTELSRYDAPQYTYQFLVTDLKVLTYGDTTVYKGSLQDPETPDPIPVVIKTDFYAKATRPSTFQREADIYELELQGVQGISIPRCFGLFQHTAQDNRISSFLLLEYSGESILSSRTVSDDFKKRALAKLYAIHHAGYIHGDLCYDNITNLNGMPFFIDLEAAQPHTCELEEKIFVGEERWFVPCDEMRQCAGILRVWAPDVQYLNCVFARDQCRMETVDELMEQVELLGWDTEAARPQVEKLIKEVEAHREHYRNVPPEKRLIHPPKAEALTPEPPE